jgi:hypothetical protein
MRNNFTIPLLPTDHETAKLDNLDNWKPLLKTLKALDTQNTPGIPIQLLEKEPHMLDPFSLNRPQTKSIVWGIVCTLIVAFFILIFVRGSIILWLNTLRIMQSCTLIRKNDDNQLKMVQLNNVPHRQTLNNVATLPMIEEATPSAPEQNTFSVDSIVVPSYFYGPGQEN